MCKQSGKRADVRAPLTTSSTAEETAAWEERGPALHSRGFTLVTELQTQKFGYVD